MGEVYCLVATAKSKFLHCKLVLSEILQCTHDMVVYWRCEQQIWLVARTLGVTFIDCTVGLRMGTLVKLDCI